MENIHIANVLADMMLIINMVTLHTYAGGGDPRGDEPDGQTGVKWVGLDVTDKGGESTIPI